MTHKICLLLPALGVHRALLCSALTPLCVCDVASAGWSGTILLCDSSERKSIILTGPALSLSLSLFCTSALGIVCGVYTHVVVKWANIHRRKYYTYKAAHSPSTYTYIFVCYFCLFCCPDQSYRGLTRLLCLSSTDLYTYLASYFYLFPTLLRSAIRSIV